MNPLIQLEFLKHWIAQRISERTTWDGAVILGISVLALLALPLIKWIAWLGIGYGAWTLWKSEK
jgi:hypothetical protein